MQEAASQSSALLPVDGFVFARSVLDQKGDEAVTLLLEAAGKDETDWFEKKAAVYRTEKADPDYRTKLEKMRSSKSPPETIAKKEEELQCELLAEIAWAIVAMHNSRGGVILVGIDDRNGVVPLADNDPDGILVKKGVGGYALDFVLGRLRREEFCLKDGKLKLHLPVAETGVFPVRCLYKGTEIIALLVPALERGKEPLLATRTTDNSPWQTAPQRGAGDVGLVKKGRYDDRWIRTAAQLSDFHHDRDQRFLDRTDLAVRFRELGLSRSSAGTAAEPALLGKEPFSSVSQPRTKNFVGRERELEVLHGLLANGRIPVVTGPGGTGKSELVLQYAARNKASYPGGLFQIDMENVTDWNQAFLSMLGKPGVRDVLGLPKNDTDKMEGESGKIPNINMSELPDGTGMSSGRFLRGYLNRKKKTVPETLSARAGKEGPILLILDNVDPPACKTLFKETALSKLELPSDVKIVATARASDLTFPASGACTEFRLSDLLPDVAVPFLLENHPEASENERKAAENIAKMLDYRILYLKAVPSLLEDDDSDFAGSWRALEAGLRDNLANVVAAGMEDDRDRTPSALWQLTQKAFAANGQKGDRWILLARIASFFSPDLGVRKTILSALWKRLAPPDVDPDVAFAQAANKLLKHGVLDDRDGKFSMHRLTCAAVRGSSREEAPSIEDSIGLSLAETALSESRDWVSLADSLPALRHVPEDLLDGKTCVDILCENRQFADLCPWAKLGHFDWKKLLAFHPQFIGQLQQVADNGNTGAQTALAFCYDNGRGVEQSAEEAVKWYRKAAEQGDAIAQFDLGLCYENGDGVEQDADEAVKWWRKAAAQGDTDAQFSLGLCYHKGDGVEQSAEEAVKWWRKAAEQGYADAQFNLGVSYYNGDGVERNAEEAVKWYLKAAEQGNAAAQFNLGSCYYNGCGVERNAEEAVKWYRKAAEQGDAAGERRLGRSLLLGIGVGKDEKAAIPYFYAAAERKDENAYAWLGYCFASGTGMPRNESEAAAWFSKLNNPADGFNEIAWFLFESGRFSDALPFAEKAVATLRTDEAFPEQNRITILDTLAAILDHLNQAAETKLVCEEILAAFSTDNESENREVALVRLGRACQRLGDKAGAADAFQKALAIVERHGGKHVQYGESADSLRALLAELSERSCT